MKRRYGKQYRLASQFQMRLLVAATGINCSGKSCERFMGTVRISPNTGQEMVNGKYTRAFHGRSQLNPFTYDEIKNAAKGFGMPQIYEHPLWNLTGDKATNDTLEINTSPRIAELESEIKQAYMAKSDFNPVKIGHILSRSNELDVIAAHVKLLRCSIIIKNRDALVNAVKCYLSILAFAIQWRSLRYIKEEFYYFIQNTIFNDPKTNLSFILNNIYPELKNRSFELCFMHLKTLNMFTEYLISISTKQSEKAKFRIRIYLQFIDIEQLIADLDFIHGVYDSYDARNNCGLLSLLKATGNSIEVKSINGLLKVFNCSNKLPNGRP